MACNKNLYGYLGKGYSKNTKSEFQGNVIIVGALSFWISYQILEATDRVGGRIQKNENFADFPIDLGAEWIHEDKSILNYLISQPGNEANVETILYQPMNVYQVLGNIISKRPNQEMVDYYEDYIKEYKFKNTTWYDFIHENFAQNIKHNIIYNSRVTTIDYSEDKVILTTENGMEYIANKVILTVLVGVLKSNAITFIPSLTEAKITAIQDVEFLPGFKLFMKFSDQFYPDVITYESTGEKTYYDVAYGKGSQDHVLGLLVTGSSAEEYYSLSNSDAIVDSVIQELDGYFDGLASENYLGLYIYEDWGQQKYTQGTWTTNFQKSSKKLNASLDYKVQGVYIIRGSLQNAILSGYKAVDRILK